MKVDKAAGTITVGRNGYPPLTVHVGSGAEVSRDGDPAALGVLGTGSITAVPDAVLVSATAASNGKLVASRVKAVSRDHFWYGRITGLNPSAATISVTRADGQRRTFLLHERTNVIQYGAGNVEWKAIKMGGMVEVIWIPGDSDTNAPVLAAHMVVLNKPYEGIKLRPPAAR
jgi:hypothetical protein